MQSTPLRDSAGRRRSPATTSSFHEGRTPRNKGLRCPPDPPTVEEIIAVMRAAGDSPEGLRLRGKLRRELPAGRLFCVLRGPTRGRRCASAGIRAQLHHAAEIIAAVHQRPALMVPADPRIAPRH